MYWPFMALSLLTDAHTYVNLHNGQKWMTLKNVPDTHDEILKLCGIHLMYLGRGMFIELTEYASPLQLAQNDDSQVQSLIVGELTMGVQKVYDDVLLSGLGVRLDSANKNKPDIPNNAKYGSDTPPLDLSLPPMEKQQYEVIENTSPLDLSIDSKPGSDKIHDKTYLWK